MNKVKILNKTRLQRKKRARAKIYGTAERPRLSIFRSNRYTYVQLIDDEARKTLISVSTKEMMNKLDVKTPAKAPAKDPAKTKTMSSEQLGEIVAKKAMEKGIKKIVFDRGDYKYHGRVKAVAEAARKQGLEF